MSVESEWKIDSTWRMYADGSLMDSGEILERFSQKRLMMSWLNEWKPEFKAEGKSRCVYEVEPTGASAKLTLTHSIERPDSKFIGEPSREAGRWSYQISSRCLKPGMLLSSIIEGTETSEPPGVTGKKRLQDARVENDELPITNESHSASRHTRRGRTDNLRHGTKRLQKMPDNRFHQEKNFCPSLARAITW